MVRGQSLRMELVDVQEEDENVLYSPCNETAIHLEKRSAL